MLKTFKYGKKNKLKGKELCVIVSYLNGMSLKEVANNFGVTASAVSYLLRRWGFVARSIAEGTSLAYTPQRKKQQREALRGKPSGAKGKTWSLNIRKVYPTTQESQHWNWRGGVTPEHVAIRMSAEYKEWRRKVFQRDNYTCVICGRRRRKGDRVVIHAHHIKSFSAHPKFRFDVNNGRTLCKECHMETDTWGKNVLHRDTAAAQVILGRMCPSDAKIGEPIPCLV